MAARRIRRSNAGLIFRSPCSRRIHQQHRQAQTTRWLSSATSLSSSPSSQQARPEHPKILQQRSLVTATSEAPSAVRDPRIQARPEGEPELEDKYPLPDKERELQLANFQTTVQELYQAGRYPEALEAAEDLLKQTSGHFGATHPDHPATASAHSNVALLHKLQGNFVASRQQYQTAARMYQRTVGSDHASYASVLHNLGQLNRSQIHFDTTLRATERLNLLESAVDFLQQAHEIRLAERGAEHPHTVASRSAWGSALAAQLLHYYKKIQPPPLANSTTVTTTLAEEEEEDTNDTKDSTTKSSSPQRHSYYQPVNADQVSSAGWDVAQEHLTQALEMAINNPRGPSLHQKKKTGTSAGKKKKRGRGRGGRGSTSASSTKMAATSGSNNEIQTLSAAAAAQNMAIFLKARALLSETAADQSHAWLQQAQTLYKQVLAVRTALLPGNHPDVYATKHSLAELLQAAGDEEAANAVRQEIVDTYDPPTPAAAAAAAAAEEADKDPKESSPSETTDEERK